LPGGAVPAAVFNLDQSVKTFMLRLRAISLYNAPTSHADPGF
jgi:hypothetical protein